MSGFMLFLLIALVVFVAVIWPTRKAAQLVKAERDGYGTVVLAILLSMFIMLGLALFIGFMSMGRGTGVGAVLALVLAQIYLYSRVFGTSMVGGFLILLIAYVIGTVISLALSLVLGAGTSLFGGPDMDRVKATVDGACACQGNQDCIGVQMELFEAEVKKQAEHMGPDDIDALNVEIERLQGCATAGLPTLPHGAAPASAPAAAQEQPAQTEAPAEPQARPAPERAPPPPRYVFVWQDAELDQLSRRVGDSVKFTLKDGRVREGTLLSLTGDSAELRSAESRGLTYSVQFDTVKSVQVYVRTVE